LISLRFSSHVFQQAGSGASKAWLPADPKYGILFEMEHIESRFGCYPLSRRVLLQLLTSLISAAGCPSDLGKASELNKLGRLRPGCTPFIEYAAYFVVPRALGSRSADDQLPFETCADSARLVARAFESYRNCFGALTQFHRQFQRLYHMQTSSRIKLN
jgi:hypothetical protein